MIKVRIQLSDEVVETLAHFGSLDYTVSWCLEKWTYENVPCNEIPRRGDKMYTIYINSPAYEAVRLNYPINSPMISIRRIVSTLVMDETIYEMPIAEDVSDKNKLIIRKLTSIRNGLMTLSQSKARSRLKDAIVIIDEILKQEVEQNEQFKQIQHNDNDK